jgi:hypothetical protein
MISKQSKSNAMNYGVLGLFIGYLVDKSSKVNICAHQTMLE